EPRGYCFVDFDNEHSAQRALTKLNGQTIAGTNPPRRFKLNVAAHGSSYHSLEYNLYVGELTPEVNDYTLHEFFARRYYTCKTAKVVLDTYGVSRGFGFVRFYGKEDQERALQEMNNVTGLGGKPIRVAIAPTKRRPGPAQGKTSYDQYYQQYHQQYQNYYRAAWDNYNESNRQNQTQQQQTSQERELAPAGTHSYDRQVHYQHDGNTWGYYREEDVEDPEITVDVEKANAEFIVKNDELFEAVEGSRWQPLDTVTPDALSLMNSTQLDMFDDE
ncbi:tRNA selenocysteine 1-associated protein 1-like, partial [Saccoglossus kowalevskii]